MTCEVCRAQPGRIRIWLVIDGYKNAVGLKHCDACWAAA